MLCMCNYCGNIIICDTVILCPICSCADIGVVPIREHPKLSISWLVSHGFPYIRERLEVESFVR